MTIAEAKEKIEQEAQKAFDTYALPLIRARMRALKIKRIEYNMGVYFFEFNDGKTMSDIEFEKIH